jgi:hypothetical protein
VAALVVLLAPAVAARAQNPAASIDVDAAAGRHAISPGVYGMSYGSTAALQELRCPLTRLGGNNTSRYNWQLNADNRGFDWYFESIAYGSATAGEGGDSFIAGAKAGGAEPMVTIPMVGWVAKLASGRNKLASFSIAKYGSQTGNDWQWFADAGNGILSSNGQPVSSNDPNDANVAADGAFQQGWINHIVNRWGSASSGGLRYYILDNEHSIWHSTHRDVHPTGAAMDEIKAKMIDYGGRVKAADPGARVVGPEEWGWSGYFWSGYDQQYYSQHGWGTFPDREAHGGAQYLPWLLDQLHQHELSTGQRVLDVFTVHYYPQGGEYGNDVSNAMQLRRNRSTRSLWDPSYVDETWINDTVRLVPRLKDWLAAHYPGLQTGITEYSWGADNHINGATAQADVLGIFGREGLDLATRWVAPDPATPTYNAYKIYRNYDGNGGAFGDVSISAGGTNPDQLAVFAAERSSDGALTVMAINKVLSGNTPATIHLKNFTSTGPAQAWQLRSTNAITRLADVAVNAGALSTSLPPQSITLFVVPKGAGLPALRVVDLTVPEPASGTSPAVVTVMLSAASGQAVTVDYATAPGSAVAGTDYVSAAGQLNFAPGSTSQTAAVTILADAAAESNEALTFNLSNPAGATIGAGQGTVTIVDAGAVQRLQFSAASYAVGEAGGSAVVTVRRVGGTAGAVSVAYATSPGTATEGVDYGAANGVLTLAPGMAARTFRVPVVNDTVPEGAETVLLKLTAVTGAAALGTPSTAVLTIRDNDPAGVFSFSAATYRAAEAAGKAVVTVRRSGGATGTATVTYATADGTALGSSDYTPTNGVLTFPTGVTSRTISVPLAKDGVAEGDETFRVSLSAPTGGATLGTPSSAVVTIGTADRALQFSAPVFTAVESAGKAVISVKRTGTPTGTLQIAYATAPGSATPDADYAPVSGTLTFPPGVMARSFNVPLVNDMVHEDPETVMLTLSGLVGDAVLGTSSATLTIKDNDGAARLQFALTDFSVAADGGLATITVTRAGGSAGSADVHYATSDGTGVAGTDYMAASGSLSFAPGVMSQSFSVQVLNAPGAGNKTLNLTLSSPGAGAVLGTPTMSKLWIVD